MDWNKSFLTVPITEEDAKKVLQTYNRVLLKSKVPWAKEYWEYWEKNLDELARNLVKARSKEVLENEWEKEKITS